MSCPPTSTSGVQNASGAVVAAFQIFHPIAEWSDRVVPGDLSQKCTEAMMHYRQHFQNSSKLATSNLERLTAIEQKWTSFTRNSARDSEDLVKNMLNDINSMHAELCQTSMMLEEISLDMRFFGERISLTLSPIGTSTRAQWKSYENLPQARKENISVLECKISGVFRKWLSINQSIETGQHNKFGKLVKSWTTDRCHSKIQRLLVNITSFINCEIRDNIKLIRGGWDSAAFSAREIATALEIAAMDLLRGRAIQITMIHSWAWVHFSPMT